MSHDASRCLTTLAATLAALLLSAAATATEDGYDAWLRYRHIDDADARAAYHEAFTAIAAPGSSPVLRAAADELRRGLSAMLDRDVPFTADATRPGVIVLAAGDPDAAGIGPDGFVLRTESLPEGRRTVIASESDRGALYGAFALLRHIQLRRPIHHLDVRERPAIALRMVNHWDNLDGAVERGYAGRSIFRWDELPRLDPRYTDYARLLASLGIGATCINNVNAGKGNNLDILTPAYLDKVAALADAFRPWGVRLFLAVGWDAPRGLGGLPTADPLDPSVAKWWAAKADEVYARVPDFGGFVIKADSEGQPGPYAYGRDHADGANMLARALRPHGGVVLWRAFVYHLNPGDDRAAMAYQHFQPLDGRFDDNILIQIKNGPIDFQVREPVSPLLGAMPATRVALELQITQEYTGHDTHLCYLAQSWRNALVFDTATPREEPTVRGILGSDAAPDGRGGAIVGVLNVGDHPTWLGHHLHMANFYAFGRLAWAPTLDPRAIADEWAGLTFGPDPQVIDTVADMLVRSYDLYEGYTSPLGLGVLHDAARHYDPAPEKRFPYHHADGRGVGYDRTVATGSGFIGQYEPPVADRYESLDTCPDELLLFFHHVPYAHRLHNGQTVIQHLYDRHFDGAAGVDALRDRWATLRGRIDAGRHRQVAEKLDAQADHARLWRDRINGFFFDLSGVADERGRFGPAPTP